jgi:diguanylate cyclase (GGDEF)-like protein
LRTTSPRAWQLFAAPAVVVVCAAVDDPGNNTWAGGSVYLFGLATMLALSATELWRLGDRRRPVTSALAVSASIAGAFYYLRFLLYVTDGPDGDLFEMYAGSDLATMVNMVLLVTVSYSMTALSNDQSTSELRRRATHDSLTNLLNHREFLARGEIELRRVRRRPGGTGSLILADLDHFKSVNDTHGHLVGDRVLETFAAVCKASVRSTDLVGRYGGEEFIVFLPGSDARAALAITSQISQTMAATATPDGVTSTASYGIAEVDRTSTLVDVIAAADLALYRAKASGRDQAVIAGQPTG